MNDFDPKSNASAGPMSTSAAPVTSTDEPVESLLIRIRTGDREAAARFVLRFEGRIRRRVRGKMKPAMRRLYDSQEIVSTLGRRLDLYVMDGNVRAETVPQFFSLLCEMADHAVIDKARVFDRLGRTEGPDGHLARLLRSKLLAADTVSEEETSAEIDRLLQLFSDPMDKEILGAWLNNRSHTWTATWVGISAPAVRKRWEKIRHRLHDYYEGGSDGQHPRDRGPRC